MTTPQPQHQSPPQNLGKKPQIHINLLLRLRTEHSAEIVVQCILCFLWLCEVCVIWDLVITRLYILAEGVC